MTTINDYLNREIEDKLTPATLEEIKADYPDIKKWVDIADEDEILASILTPPEMMR